MKSRKQVVEETGQSKIFPNAAFGYRKVAVERPLRLQGIDPERAEDALPVIKKIHK